MSKWYRIALILLLMAFALGFTELAQATIGQCPLPEQDYFIIVNDCANAEYIIVSGGEAQYITDSDLKGKPEKIAVIFQLYQYSKQINRLIEFQLDCS